MSEKATEVLINGVRYVPYTEAVVGLEAFREALLDQWWGIGYRGADPKRAGEDMRVLVSDDPECGEPLNDFMAALAAKVAGHE